MSNRRKLALELDAAKKEKSKGHRHEQRLEMLDLQAKTASQEYADKEKRLHRSIDQLQSRIMVFEKCCEFIDSEIPPEITRDSDRLGQSSTDSVAKMHKVVQLVKNFTLGYKALKTKYNSTAKEHAQLGELVPNIERILKEKDLRIASLEAEREANLSKIRDMQLRMLLSTVQNR